MKHILNCSLLGLVVWFSTYGMTGHAGTFERSLGVMQSDWKIENTVGGMTANLTYAFTETEVKARKMAGEIGILCSNGNDGQNRLIIVFRVYENGKAKSWTPDTVYRLNMRSNTRKEGLIWIGGVYLETYGGVISPLVVGKDTDAVDLLKSVAQELQGDDETFVWLSLDGESKIGFMFSHRKARTAISSVLQKCGIN